MSFKLVVLFFLSLTVNYAGETSGNFLKGNLLIYRFIFYSSWAKKRYLLSHKLVTI